MKKVLLFILIMANFASVNAQFTVVPTSDDRFITGLAMHGDTLVMKGSTDYIGKSYDMGLSVQEIQDNLPLNIVYQDFQIVDGVYYMYGQATSPYSMAVVRSTDYGFSWDTLHQSLGLFGALAVFDSTRALLGGIGGGRFSVLNHNAGMYWYDYPPLAGGGFADAKYLNKDTCFLLGSQTSAVSHDGGINWGYSGISGGNLRRIAFVGGDTIYTAGGSHDIEFEYSYTLGTSGSSSLYDGTGYFIDILNMWFDNSMHGYLFGAAEGINDIYPKCTIYETFDRGLTWTQHQLEYDGVIASVVQANDSVFFLGGADPWQNSFLLKWNRNQPFQTLGVEIQTQENSFSIYPNPTKDRLFIKTNSPSAIQKMIQIIDVSGKLVFETPFANEIDISSLKSGIYIVVLESEGVRRAEKLIVE